MQDLARDGIRLAYAETGRGAPPVVFVHELAGDHTHFAPQVAYFGQRHRVVAVDLRGHGASAAPKQDYTIAGFADDLAWLCRALALYRPVLVGHGLGGLIALDLAVRYPDQPGGIVMLDALQGPADHETFAEFMDRGFDPGDDPDRKARILAQVDACPQHVRASCWGQGSRSADRSAGSPVCQVPVLALSATAPVTHDWLLERCPSLLVGQTVGAGHWHQLEVPDQVNAMIGRFLGLVTTTLTVSG